MSPTRDKCRPPNRFLSKGSDLPSLPERADEMLPESLEHDPGAVLVSDGLVLWTKMQVSHDLQLQSTWRISTAAVS